MNLAKLVEDVSGKKPSDEEIKRLYRLATLLGVNPENDPIMALMAVLEHYFGLYSTMPDRIQETVSQLRPDIEILTRQAASNAISGMVEAVKNTAEKTAIRTGLKWVAVTASILILLLSGIGYFGYREIDKRAFERGFEAGQENGLRWASSESEWERGFKAGQKAALKKPGK